MSEVAMRTQCNMVGRSVAAVPFLPLSVAQACFHYWAYHLDERDGTHGVSIGMHVLQVTKWVGHASCNVWLDIHMYGHVYHADKLEVERTSLCGAHSCSPNNMFNMHHVLWSHSLREGCKMRSFCLYEHLSDQCMFLFYNL